MSQVSKFRIVTYNAHKCIGVDRRLDPARIVSVPRITARLRSSANIRRFSHPLNAPSLATILPVDIAAGTMSYRFSLRRRKKATRIS